MKTIEMTEPGGPEVLRPGTRERPDPGAGEIVVKVFAAGVNGPDIVQRKGFYPPPKGASDLLGLEVSGEVVSAGADARFAVGDLVCGLTNGGGYAEYVAVDAAHCLPIPEGVDPVDAAGLPETYFTVWSNVFFRHEMPRDGRFLVHGGAGGIGSTAIQLGRAAGLEVLTTAAPGEDCAFATSLGAARAIDFTSEDFVAITREAGGADIILDTLGGEYVARNIKAAKHDARIIQLAFNKGSKVEIDLMPVMLKRISYTGATLRSRPDAFKAAVASDLGVRVWPLFASGKLRTVTHAILPFDQAEEAHRMMEAAHHRGKILLVPTT